MFCRGYNDMCKSVVGKEVTVGDKVYWKREYVFSGSHGMWMLGDRA